MNYFNESTDSGLSLEISSSEILLFFLRRYIVAFTLSSDITLLHRIIQQQTVYVHYDYQQIIKRENPSCWLDLNMMSPQKRLCRMQRVRTAITRRMYKYYNTDSERHSYRLATEKLRGLKKS